MNISSIVKWEALHCLTRIARRSNRYVIGAVFVAMILAMPKMSVANETALANIVLGYNNNVFDELYGSATFIIQEFDSKTEVARGRFTFGKLKPPGGVARWHRVVPLQARKEYQIKIIRGTRESQWLKFKASTNSFGFSARTIGVHWSTKKDRHSD